MPLGLLGFADLLEPARLLDEMVLGALGTLGLLGGALAGIGTRGAHQPSLLPPMRLAYPARPSSNQTVVGRSSAEIPQVSASCPTRERPYPPDSPRSLATTPGSNPGPGSETSTRTRSPCTERRRPSRP